MHNAYGSYQMFYVSYLCSLVIHYFLGCQITLVTNKQLVDILICISVNFIEPLLDVVEAFLICHIIHNLDNTHASGIIQLFSENQLQSKDKQ